MFHHRLTISFTTIFIPLSIIGQLSSPARFKDLVFTDVDREKNIAYQTEIKDGIKKKYYLLDLYQPNGDSVTNRPLIIWMHGGGFKLGNKRSRGIPLWSKTFAQRGYVCAAINYRHSKKRPLKRFTDLAEGCYDAIEDLHHAVAFLKKNASQYRIDTSRIILAGNSAGGIIALQAVYSSFAEIAQLVHVPGADTASREHNPLHIVAVINYWGALFDLDWLKNSEVPIVSVHGNNDGIVPYDHKEDSPLYGSFAIHQQADSLSIHNRLKTYDGYAHELQKHFNPFWAGRKAKQHWREAGQFAADFLYEQLFSSE